MNKEDKEFIKSEFQEDPTQENIKFLAEKFEVSVRTIKAILTYAGLYSRQGYLTKTGEKPVSKAEIFTLIAKALEVDQERLEGLDKCNKSTLRLLLDKLDPSSAEYFKP